MNVALSRFRASRLVRAALLVVAAASGFGLSACCSGWTPCKDACPPPREPKKDPCAPPPCRSAQL